CRACRKARRSATTSKWSAARKRLQTSRPDSSWPPHGPLGASRDRATLEELGAIDEQNVALVAGSPAGIQFRVCPVDLAIPFVGIAGLRLDERDLVLEPEQGP